MATALSVAMRRIACRPAVRLLPQGAAFGLAPAVSVSALRPLAALHTSACCAGKKGSKGGGGKSGGKQGGKSVAMTFDPSQVPLDLAKIDSGMADTIAHLRETYAHMRTGEATPALLSEVFVERDGAQHRLEHIGVISVRNKSTLMVTLFDEADVAETVKAIQASGVAPNPVREGIAVKVVVPKITKEYRQDLAKVAKDDMEQTRTRLRGARNKAVASIKRHANDLSEDLVRQVEGYIQGLLDKHSAELDQVYEKKHNEIMTG